METSSNSQTEQQTSSSTTDARVGADNGAVVIQQGGSQNISFSPEVTKVVDVVTHGLVDFSNGVVSKAGDLLGQSLATQERQTNAILDFGKNALAASPATPSAASAAIVSGINLNTLQTPLIIAAVGLAAVFIFKKK